MHEPVGVCALIAPWNYPLLQMSWKLAPALAAGNTVVLKPSELTPLTTVALTALTAEADLPPGTVNLLLGSGDPVGQALVSHPGVDLHLVHRRAGDRSAGDGGGRQGSAPGHA